MLVSRKQSDLVAGKFFCACLFLLLVFRLAAKPEYRLALTQYNQPTYFNGKKIVRISKGDNPAWKEPLLDDTAWDVTSLPSDWGELYPDYNGICWYRLHIYLPQTLPAESIGISLGVICDADETYLNGVLIGSGGAFAAPVDSAYDKIRIYELPLPLLKPGQDNILAIRVRGVFTYSNGPYLGTMKIDKFADLLAEYYSRELFDLSFVIIYLVVGIYFLLFFIRRSADKENLFFALFTLSISVYFFLRTQLKYLFNFPFFWMKKLEYLVLAWLVYLIMEFLIFYFKKKHRWIHFVFLGLTILFFLIILFTTGYSFWDNVNQYFMMPSWLIGVITGFYIIVSKFKKELDARLMLFTLVILFFTFVNDILVNMVFYNFIRLANYGFLFFIGSMAIILSNRFVRLHREVEDLNKNLELKVLFRTDELNRTVSDLAFAKEETDNILRNVQEGIFLIDRELRIGQNYSQIMESIFERQMLGGTTLPELLKEITPPDVISQAEDFLTIIFTRNLPAKRLARLNPLDEVSTVFVKENNKLEKFLNFAFTKISGEKENTFILATVRDITDRKKLALKVKRTEELAEKEASLILEIIHLNPLLLKNFLKESQLEIFRMEDLLKKAQFSEDLKALLKNIYTSVHTIKGDAGMLDIKSLAEVAHNFENTIKELYNKIQIKAVELINLPYGLIEMKNILARIDLVIEKITEFRSSFSRGIISDDEYIAESLRNMAARVAERELKKVKVDLRSFHLPMDSGLNIISIKRVLLQLVKNAVVHGIETPAVRIKKGKQATGRIILKTERKTDNLILKVTDDGGLLDTEHIRQTVINAGKFSLAELAAMHQEKIVLLIFETGVSTRADITIDAGRGIGLDIVRETVKELGGKTTLAYKAGKYTQFRITLPLAT